MKNGRSCAPAAGARTFLSAATFEWKTDQGFFRRLVSIRAWQRAGMSALRPVRTILAAASQYARAHPHIPPAVFLDWHLKQELA